MVGHLGPFCGLESAKFAVEFLSMKLDDHFAVPHFGLYHDHFL
jgi:hypothetical protein